MSDNHRRSYVALVAALRDEFTPLALEATWIQMRQYRYDSTSLGTLAQAVHDAHDIAYDTSSVTGGPTQDAYDAAVRALEKHGARADQAEAALSEFRDKLAALAAIEDYIGESGENAARNMRDLLAGRGEDNNDPRVQALAWGLEWITTGPYSPAGDAR